jgi:hypothetical protein
MQDTLAGDVLFLFGCFFWPIVGLTATLILFHYRRRWHQWRVEETYRQSKADRLINWQIEEYEHRMRSQGKVPSSYGYEAPSPDTVVASYTGYRVDRNERW